MKDSTPIPQNPNPRVLVTGAAGFIGSYLCELLLKKNCQVLGVDNLKTGNLENLNRLFKNTYFDFLKFDNLSTVTRLEGFHYVFHLCNSDDLPNLLRWSQKNRSKFLLLVVGERQADISKKDFVLDFVQNHDLNARVVATQNVYGPRMSFDHKDSVQRLLFQAVNRQSLALEGKGSARVYPTFVADLVYGLAQAMFSLGTEGKTFSLVNLPGMSADSFARSVKKFFGKDLEITYLAPRLPLAKNFSGDQFEKLAKENQSTLGWQAATPPDEGLKHTFDYFSKKQNRSRPDLPKTDLFKKKLSALLVVFMVFVFPLSVLAAASVIGTRQLKQAQTALLVADLSRAGSSASKAGSAFQIAQNIFQIYSWGLNRLGQRKIADRLDKIFIVGREVSAGTIDLNAAAKSASQLGRMVFQNQPGGIENYLREIKAETDQAFLRFSAAQALVQSENKLLPEEIPFEKINTLLIKAQEALVLAPEILGQNGKKTYLVLFQNNMELRPTGGFIGSYGLITFDKGKMIDFQISDVYSADGQLKGHVEPPAEIKKYLGEAGWYLRDSNWHPDFPVSARRAEWFLEKEIGRSVDGTIGLNLSVAQRVLANIGEIEVGDFQEKINQDNLFERAEYYSEVNFFPGSTQKIDFLSALARALFEKLKSADQTVWLATAKSVWESLREKDLLIALRDSHAASLMAQNEWDGRLRQIACSLSAETACYLDYLAIFEANVGVNKANYFVKRAVSHQAEIDRAGTVRKKLSIHYHNQSPSENFPAGRYKNYLRILTPPGSRVESVFLDQEKLSVSDFDVQEILGKQSLGFLVEVPVRSEKYVEVNYTLKEKINFDGGLRYLLLWQKQSGIRDERVDFLLSVPPGVSLFQPNPPAQQSKFFDDQTGEISETLTFTAALTEDLVFEVGAIIDK